MTEEIRPQARLAAQERFIHVVAGRIEELAQDTAEEFRALRQEVLQGFKQAHTYMQENIEAVMATKEDIRKLEGEITELKTAQSEQGKKLDQILTLLQERK